MDPLTAIAAETYARLEIRTADPRFCFPAPIETKASSGPLPGCLAFDD